MTTKIASRGRGRPRLGVYRVECTLPQAALDELLRRENESGSYRSRIAAKILCDELIGGVTGFTQSGGSMHQT